MDVNEQERMSNITQIKVQNQFFIAVLHFTVTLASSTYPKMSIIRPHIMQLNVTLYLSITDTSGLCCRFGVYNDKTKYGHSNPTNIVIIVLNITLRSFEYRPEEKLVSREIDSLIQFEVG